MSCTNNFPSFQAQNCVYGSAWDSFQAMWLIKHLEKIRAKCRIVLFKMKEKPALQNLYHWYGARAGLFHAVSTIHSHLRSLFSTIAVVLLHISIWRLFCLNPSVCVLWQEPGSCYTEPVHPFYISSSLKPPASRLGDQVPFKYLETGWPVWGEILAELMQREKEPLLPS